MPKGKPKLKTAVMTLRVEPQIKVIAELAAKRERRSVTSLVEILLLKHGESLGIESPQPSKQEPTS
jgi:predicted HicB family RNase H-like nuclease